MGLLVVLSGCSLATGPLAFTASPASVCGESLSSTGYVSDVSQWENVSREVEVGGQSRTITISNYVNGYVREAPNENGTLESKGGFAVLATPKAETLGQSLNPVRNWSPREMVDNLAGGLDQYGSLQNVQQETTDQVTVLGTATTRTRFSATGQQRGDPVDVSVEVLRVEHGGDYVIAGSVYEQSNAGERHRIDTLLGCVEHEDSSSSVSGTPFPTATEPEDTSQTPTAAQAELPEATIEELNRNPGKWVGETVRVRGALHRNTLQQGEVDNSVLLSDYRRAAQDRALPATGTLPLDTSQLAFEAKAEWQESHQFELVGEVVRNEDDNEETPTVRLQVERFRDLGNPSIFVERRRTIDPEFTSILRTEPSECRFAVVISGGIDDYNNHQRYWNDITYTYKAMNDSFGLPDDQIYVHYYEGSNTGHATDVDGRDIIDADASEAAINDTFDELSRKLRLCSAESELMVFTYNHGTDADPEGKSLLGWGGDGQSLTPVELRGMFQRVNEAGLDEGYVMMKQCYSGQFLDARNDQPDVDLMSVGGVSDPVVTAIGTAGRNDELTYSSTGPDGVGIYGYHFVAALAGTYANGTAVTISTVDQNKDGEVSWKEAHDYAVKHDQFARSGQEHPQFAGFTQKGPGY